MTLAEAHEIQRRELIALRREVEKLRSTSFTRKEKEDLEKELRKAKRSSDSFEKKYHEMIGLHLAAQKEISRLENELTGEQGKCVQLGREKERLELALQTAQAELAELKGINKKLTIQAHKDFTNSSLPSSAITFRKKIPNSRVKTGRKPGAQSGHEGHRRTAGAGIKASETIMLPAPDCVSDPDYYETDKIISKKVIDVRLEVFIREYRARIYRKHSDGSRVHAPFPAGVCNEINYGPGLKAAAFFLNQYGNVPIRKTSEFFSSLTGEKVSLSTGMISSLGAQFSGKSESDRLKIFRQLAEASTLYTDATTGNVNGRHKAVFISTDKNCVLYQARETKGHEGVKGTPVEKNLNTLVHDHDKTFYHYGSHHQECLAHVLRYLQSAVENEPQLSWHRDMQELVREMIHFAKESPGERYRSNPRVREYHKRYRNILKQGKAEYKKHPPAKEYRDGFNLCTRMLEYMDDHLYFLSHPEVDWTNNISERGLRTFKRKQQQATAFRCQESMGYTCNALTIINTAKM